MSTSAPPKLQDPKKLLLTKNREAFQEKLLSWYSKQKKPFPWRLLWSEKQDPYHVWVSEIMLQQTVIAAVLPAYERFFQMFPTPQSLALADEEQVRQTARGLGYYRRFRFMHQAAKVLTQDGKHPPDWPRTYRSWMNLPGIGQYTAAALASITNKEPVPVVDGNVERVFCRLLDIRSEPNLPILKRYFFSLGLLLISQDSPGDYNQAFMEIGQTTCRKTSPLCEQCPLVDFCLAFKRDSQGLAPRNKKRVEKVKIHLELYIPTANQGEHIGLIQRPKEARFLKETWGFLTRITTPSPYKEGWDGLSQEPISSIDHAELIGSVKHNITKYEIEVATYHIALKRKYKNFSWYKKTEMETALVSSLDQKAWRLLSNYH